MVVGRQYDMLTNSTGVLAEGPSGRRSPSATEKWASLGEDSHVTSLRLGAVVLATKAARACTEGWSKVMVAGNSTPNWDETVLRSSTEDIESSPASMRG